MNQPSIDAYLIENGSKTTDERPVNHGYDSWFGFSRNANVEDLAIVAGIGVVTILTVFTTAGNIFKFCMS